MIEACIVITYIGLLLTLVGTGREASDEFFKWMARLGLLFLTTGITWWTLYSLGYLG